MGSPLVFGLREIKRRATKPARRLGLSFALQARPPIDGRAMRPSLAVTITRRGKLRAVQTDVFLSHSHADAAWVEALAGRLEDTNGFKVWLDRWVLVPGQSWQQAMARGLEETKSCAVLVGAETPAGWFQQEVERALDLQTRNSNFRVIPVLLPEAHPDRVPAFASLRTWVDFRAGQDQDYAFHVLCQGIKGEPIGRWPPNPPVPLDSNLNAYETRIRELARFRALGVHEEVIVEYERRILDLWFTNGKA